jgi:hypothetical protein
MTAISLQLGFTYVADSNVPNAKCVFSYETLGNYSIVTAKSQRYLHAKHVDCKQEPVVFFQRDFDELKNPQTNLTSAIKGENGNVCEASYKAY